MKPYNPDKSPDPADWLDTDESERIDLVSSYHRRARVRLPNLRVHATIHVIVENQVAMGERAVVETLTRLQSEGLNRHDAIHAIGSVLVEHMNELLKEGHRTEQVDPNEAYFQALQELTAAGWRNAG